MRQQQLELGLLMTRRPALQSHGPRCPLPVGGGEGARCGLGALAIAPLLTCLAPAVSEPDRAWEPLSQPGAGVSLGALPAAPGSQPRRAPRPRGLPHPAGLRALRYARYCISCGQVCAAAGPRPRLGRGSLEPPQGSLRGHVPCQQSPGTLEIGPGRTGGQA